MVLSSRSLFYPADCWEMMIVTEPSSQHSLLSAGEAAMESCPVEGSLGGALHSGHDLKEYCKKKKVRVRFLLIKATLCVNRISRPSVFVLLLIELIMFMFVHRLLSLEKPAYYTTIVV